jgi:hypothetical protein
MMMAHSANPPNHAADCDYDHGSGLLERLSANLSMNALASKPTHDCYEQQHECDDGAGLAHPPLTPKLVHVVPA